MFTSETYDVLKKNADEIAAALMKEVRSRVPSHLAGTEGAEGTLRLLEPLVQEIAELVAVRVAERSSLPASPAIEIETTQQA